jgi:hypothetical protein
MKILISLAHPAHVHVFKNIIWSLQQNGDSIKILARNKEQSTVLLDNYNLKYTLISRMGTGITGLGIEMLVRIRKMVPIIKSYNPYLIISLMDPSVAISSKICGKKYICLADTEHAKMTIKLSHPFTDAILTPSCFNKDLGKKQVRYNGYHELAYLHPNYFTPNPAVLEELGLEEGDPFIILRFVSWGASHDIGHHGIQNKIEFVKELEKYGRVLITSEADMGPEFEKYKIKVSPEKLHDLLYYATLYIGEGGTTASEAATLGTHAIHISTTAKYCGLFNMLHDYGLMWTFDDEKGVINISKNLLQERDLWKIGKEKRDSMVEDYLDVTDFMVRVIDEYPKSLQTIQQRKKYVGDN